MENDDINALFQKTLEGDREDDAPWKAVHELRRIGSREVFEIARQWCSSTVPLHRVRGLDVIAQLGRTAEHPHNNFPEESFAIVSTLISSEKELQPLDSAIASLGHLRDFRAVPLIAQFRSHPSEEIRFSVACALGQFANETLSVEALLELMRDEDEEVRDWATFGLGVLGDQDSEKIREALACRLDDSCQEAQEEAIAGLAKRHDLRALPHLLAALDDEWTSVPIIDAACEFLGLEREEKNWITEDYAVALRKQYSKYIAS